MTLEGRITHHVQMAKGYRTAYMKQAVQEGETYDAWEFAGDGVYVSPYFTGDETYPLSEFPADHTKDGVKMGFYSYSFVETNNKSEVARWETHVNDEYGPFLEVAIGVSGPFHGREEYVEALERTLSAAGVKM